MYGIFEILEQLERDVVFPLPVGSQQPSIEVPVVAVSADRLPRDTSTLSREDISLGTIPAPRQLQGFTAAAELLDDTGEYFDVASGGNSIIRQPNSDPPLDVFLRLMQTKGAVQYEYVYPLSKDVVEELLLKENQTTPASESDKAKIPPSSSAPQLRGLRRRRPKALLLNRPVPYPRRIINVGQLFHFLVARYGAFFEWQLVEGLEQFDPADQMRLFAGAALIIAGMGTSLHMMAGMRDHAGVAEGVGGKIRPTIIELAPMLLLQTKQDSDGRLLSVKDEMGPYECNENIFEVGVYAGEAGPHDKCRYPQYPSSYPSESSLSRTKFEKLNPRRTIEDDQKKSPPSPVESSKKI